MEYFGFEEWTRALAANVEKDEKVEPWDEDDLEKEEPTEFRGLAARLNFLSTDCPDLQFPVKACSRQMATPKKGSWKAMKKVARYLFGWQRKGDLEI